MLRHIRLLIFDLDYVIFDCSSLKVQALRQSLIALADQITQSAQLPEISDAEEGFREHGCRWIQHLEIGLDEWSLEHLQRAYAIHENRLVEAGSGRLYPGIEEILQNWQQAEVSIALGAEATRDYLISVLERRPMDSLFQVALCTEEFGMGGAEEMLSEAMRQAEANPSETLVLGTRPQTFRAARALDIRSIGCSWGIREHAGLAEADFQCKSISDLLAAVEKAETLTLRDFD